MTEYIDVHSHLYEYSESEIASILDSLPLTIVAVGDDYESSIKVIKLAEQYPDRVYPCVGLHPWEVGKIDAPLDEARRIIELAYRHDIDCLGEIGLDTKFVGETIDVQRRVFDLFLKAAAEAGYAMNLHTAGTWEEVYEKLVSAGIERAVFHWYTGPLYLIPRLKSQGYFISINPAVSIQRKHQEVVVNAPLDVLVTESDSPYNYRGMKLNPLMVRDVVAKIAELKRADTDLVRKTLLDNARRLFRL